MLLTLYSMTLGCRDGLE